VIGGLARRIDEPYRLASCHPGAHTGVERDRRTLARLGRIG